MRHDDILAIDHEACLSLLACPAMIEVARSLSGRGSVPLQLDILYKQQHPHPVIKWHQGAPHSRAYPYLNVGIYLDDAPAGDGCVRYVPGSQHRLHEIDRISAEHGWEVPGAIEQPAKAGDILVQDMMNRNVPPGFAAPSTSSSAPTKAFLTVESRASDGRTCDGSGCAWCCRSPSPTPGRRIGEGTTKFQRR